MHSVSGAEISGPQLLAFILKSFKFLFAESLWFKERERYLENDEHSVFFFPVMIHFRLIQEAVDAIDSLSDSDCLSLLGVNKGQTCYLCP